MNHLRVGLHRDVIRHKRVAYEERSRNAHWTRTCSIHRPSLRGRGTRTTMPQDLHVGLKVAVDRPDIAPICAQFPAQLAKVVDRNSAVSHQRRDDVSSEVVPRLTLGIVNKNPAERLGIEDIDSHTDQRPVWLERNASRGGRLFLESGHAGIGSCLQNAEMRRGLEWAFYARYRELRSAGRVDADQVEIIHAVDMVAGQDHDIVRLCLVEAMEILVYRVRCSAVDPPGRWTHTDKRA